MTSPEATLLALGSINLDLQVRGDRWPEPGETMIVRDLYRGGGGKAANRAYLARRLGAPALLLARVGDDDFAAEALAGPRRCGVDTTDVQVAAGQATGLSMIVVRADGNKTILLAPNANEAWAAGELAVVTRRVAAAPAGSLLTVDLEVPVAVVLAAARAARERGFTVVLDPSPGDRMTDELYSLVDVMTPNVSETRALTGITVADDADAQRAGRALVARGVPVACIKRAGGGCTVVREDLCETIAPLDVEVVDETGAGDAFAGALGVALLERQQIVAAVRFAVAASSLAVTGYGSQPAYPDRGQLERARAGREPRG